jgi:hypothetical protein
MQRSKSNEQGKVEAEENPANLTMSHPASKVEEGAAWQPR